MSLKNELVGRKFNMLTVLDIEPELINGYKKYYCECECGKFKWVRKDLIKNGGVKSCGCLKVKVNQSNTRFIDLTNQRFGRLIVISCVGKNNYQRYTWECLCDCGNKIIVTGTHLRGGGTKSCGCLREEKKENHYKRYRILLGKDPNIFLSPENELERVKFKFSDTYKNILKRDNHTCQFCPDIHENLEIHHILSWSKYPALRYEETNLITLCRICHIPIIHNGNNMIPVHEDTTKILQKKIEEKYLQMVMM